MSDPERRAGLLGLLIKQFDTNRYSNFASAPGMDNWFEKHLKSSNCRFSEVFHLLCDL